MVDFTPELELLSVVEARRRLMLDEMEPNTPYPFDFDEERSWNAMLVEDLNALRVLRLTLQGDFTALAAMIKRFGAHYPTRMVFNLYKEEDPSEGVNVWDDLVLELVSKIEQFAGQLGVNIPDPGF